MSVQRNVSGVQVEDDLPRRRAMRVEEQVHEQRLDRRAVVADAVVAARLARRRMFQPVQRALANQSVRFRGTDLGKWDANQSKRRPRRSWPSA
jgi:hypothetical protein